MIKNKKWIIICSVALVIIVAAVLISGKIGGQNKNVGSARNQITVYAERGDLEVWVSGTGTVEAALEEEVRTRISGTLSQFNMTDQQQVRAGDVLARLDVQDLNSQIENAKLEIEIQEKELKNLRKELTSSTIYAPIKGEVNWNVQVGDTVQANSILGTIRDLQTIEVIGLFNGEQLKTIKVGQEAEVVLPAYLNRLNGIVTEINTTPRPNEQGAILYEVKVTLNQAGSIVEGTLAQVTINTGTTKYQSLGESTIAYPEPIVIRSDIAGEVISIGVNSGNSVSKNQVLMEITNDTRRDQIEDQISTSELRLRQKRLDLENYLEQQSENNIYSKIIAPINGVVVLSNTSVGVGDQVGQGNVLAKIVDYEQMQVVIPVDELDIAKIVVGQQVRITADALGEKEMQGRVAKINPQGNSQNGVSTFDVTVAIESAENLLVGMTVNADILVNHKQDTILVPIEAVHEQGGKNIVWVADGGKDEDGAVEIKAVPVTIGAYDASKMEIIEGLQEGQAIIIQAVSGNASTRNQTPGIGGGIPGGGMPGGVMPSGGQGGGSVRP